MTRFLPLTVPVLLLALAGCDKDSSELPRDGRDFDGDSYNQPGTYSGVVIDGYLRNARVWLDIDGDFQYTPGPLNVTLPSGTVAVLEDGEPTVMTGEGGVFTLDTSQLIQDPKVAPDLVPKDYPLMVLAIPGQTIDETFDGGRPVEKAFLMTAPKGVRTVTPLTSLLRFRTLAGAAQQATGDSPLAEAFRDTNLQRDYIKAGDERAHAYARAFARYMAEQFPVTASEAYGNGDGTERLLSSEAVELLAVSFARNAGAIVQLVDEAAPSGHYQNVDVAALDLPVEVLDLDNPVVLAGQTVFAHGSNNRLPANSGNLEQSAEFTYQYAPDGRLLAVVANGCLRPSMREIARLANAGGYIADTGMQWLPNVSLSQKSRGFFEQEGADEQLLFDWAGNKAYFQTTTDCHEGLAAAAELGGANALTFEWVLEDGLVTSIGDGQQTLVPDYSNAGEGVWGYSLSDDGGELERVTLDAALESCDADADAEGKSRVVTAKRPFTFTGYAAPAGFQNLHLEFDTRDGWNRLLRFSFLDPVQDAIPALAEHDGGYQWSFYYQNDNQIIDAKYPNLIQTAHLDIYRGDKACGRDATTQSGSVFARVSRSYGRLSEVLAGGIE